MEHDPEDDTDEALQMEQEFDTQFSAAQAERRQDSENREQHRQLVFNSRMQEWNEVFGMQLHAQRAVFSGHTSMFKQERKEHMRKFCELLSQRIDEASRWADDIVDEKLRECRTAVVDAAACLEKAGLESLGLVASPDHLDP